MKGRRKVEAAEEERREVEKGKDDIECQRWEEDEAWESAATEAEWSLYPE